MINIFEVNETNKMIEQENLDVRTITMGISLLDCIDSDLAVLNEKIYKKITTCAKDLDLFPALWITHGHRWRVYGRVCRNVYHCTGQSSGNCERNRVYDSLSGGSDCSLERILSGSNLE